MRNLSAGTIAHLSAEQGERVFLVALEFSSGTVRMSTGSRNLDWNGFTWEAVGGNLQVGQIQESPDAKGQGCDIILSGVSQAITAQLLTSHFRGRSMWAGEAILNQTSGAVDDVIQLIDGLQLDNYEVEEKTSSRGVGTVDIKTRIRHRLMVDEYRGIRANVHAHQHYFTGDTFFRHVASISARRLFWGTGASTTPGGGGGGGGGALPGS